jgi:striatin 1/3/4
MVHLVPFFLLDHSSKTQINSIVSHPTMHLAMTAHEDGEIRIFDVQSGKCVDRLPGHVGGVATLSISPDGSTLASGGFVMVYVGYDGSIKWWDLASHSCIQETTCHGPRDSSGVWSIDFHGAYKGMMASGGADCNALVYSK